MDFDKPPRIEQIGKNRERLLALEKEGKYVFHGSPDVIKELEPRQARNQNKITNEMEEHGKPAVCATPYADQAIFRALTNFPDKIGDATSEFGIDGDRLYFSATPNLLELAKKKTGKVYVLDKQKFHLFEGEYRCEDSIVPIEVIEVVYEDLPPNIETIVSGSVG